MARTKAEQRKKDKATAAKFAKFEKNRARGLKAAATKKKNSKKGKSGGGG